MSNDIGNFTNIHLFSNQLSSVQSLRYVCCFATPWTATPSFPVHHHFWNLLKLMSIESVIPSNHLILFIPFSFIQSSSGSILMRQFFASGGQIIGASISTSVLPMDIQDWFPLHWLVWSPCSQRDSQESSPTPQFKSINSSALCLLYGPTLTTIPDYLENHSFDYRDLCWQSNVSAF